jgi:small conductance mechanosensitive channel
LILVLKPFKVGDSIEAQGQAGKVLDIRLFNTVLRTADNQTILLPNGIISTGIVKNVNAAKTRRLEWVVSFSSGTDFEAVERLLTTLLRADGRILTTPAPEVVIGRLNPGTIDVVAHAWVASGDYSDVLNTMNAVIYKTLPERGFPFPSSTLNVSLTK